MNLALLKRKRSLVKGIIVLLASCVWQSVIAQHKQFNWQQTDAELALLQDGEVLWQLNFDKEKDKPFFHPLRSMNGHDLTLERPADHPWHRGLWFSWKYINQVNYWEEDPKSGLSKGRSKIEAVQIKKNKDYSATIKLQLLYFDDLGGVLREQREILISSPKKSNQAYSIIFKHIFTALKDAALDLDKPALRGGVSWGGYAGLGFRGAKNLSNVSFLAASGWHGTNDTTGYGTKERWMDMTANASKNSEDKVGITIFNHPGNPNSPSPWYIWYAAGKNVFFMPSPLFDGPMNLTKDATLKLSYKCWIHDGKKSVKEIEKEYNMFK